MKRLLALFLPVAVLGPPPGTLFGRSARYDGRMKRPEDSWLRLRIVGVVSMASREFQQHLALLEETETDVIIDLTDVKAIDSAAIGALMRVRTKREKLGLRCWFDAQLPGLKRILHSANAKFASNVA